MLVWLRNGGGVNKLKYKKKTKNQLSFFHLTIGTLQASTLFYRKIYVFSNKQFIAPVKINIIFLLLDVLENLLICNLQHHTWTFLPNIKFLLNKNGDTKKVVSVTKWKRWKQILFTCKNVIWYWLSLSLSLSLSI